MLTESNIETLIDRSQNVKWDRNAFNCSKCPKGGCPAWWKFKWNLYNTELKIHSEKQIEGCGYVLQPIFLADMITTSYRSMDSDKQIADGVKKFGELQSEEMLKVKQAIVGIGKMVMGPKMIGDNNAIGG